jgi:thiamine kinase-like enzyme
LPPGRDDARVSLDNLREGSASRVAALAIWFGRVDPQPLAGGITNQNFTVEDRGRRYVVRVGDDIFVHGVVRANEQAASRAAHLAGLSPGVVHAEPGILVLDFVDGRTLKPEDIRNPANLERLIDMVRRCHRDIPQHLRGPAAMFWVFHVVRDYGHTLRDGNSRHVPLLSDLLARAGRLETAVGPIDVVFGHNDLLAANFIDDGKRLWLVDWEYAGFNSPLFDLGGLASNSELAPEQAEQALALYFGKPVDDQLRRRAAAMTAASLLRETMWSMVSEIHSTVDFDYAAYTAENLRRFEAAYAAFVAMDRA